MSINFATLRSVTIPEGNVIRIEKDSFILWSLKEIVRARLMDCDGVYLMTSAGEYISIIADPSDEPIYDVVFENGTLYIKTAPATLNDTTLEVR